MNKISKKILTCLTGATVLASMSMPVLAADTIVSPGNCANFTVTDSDGNLISGGDMQLLDSNGKVVASWKGNSPSSASVSSSAQIAKSSFESNFNSLASADNGPLKTAYLKKSTWNYTEIYTSEMTAFLNYNTSYTAYLDYLPSTTSADLTVPANQMMLNVDSKWASKIYDGGIEINDTDYMFKSNAGTQKYFDITPGDYNTMCINGSGRGGYGSFTSSDTATTYVKETINLRSFFPSYFNEDGTTTKNYSSYGDVNFNYANDSSNPQMGSTLFFVSGSVVNAVFPDSNGNVTIYVDSASAKVSLSTDFYYQGTSGGGISENIFYTYGSKKIDFTTISLPSSGLNFTNIPAGNYTLHQLSAAEGYALAKDMPITISDSTAVQSFNFVNDAAVAETTTTTAAVNSVVNASTTTASTTTTGKSTAVASTPKTGSKGIAGIVSVLVVAIASAGILISKKKK